MTQAIDPEEQPVSPALAAELAAFEAETKAVMERFAAPAGRLSVCAVTSRDVFCPGELWVTPDALLRRRRGWRATVYAVKSVIDAMRGRCSAVEAGFVVEASSLAMNPTVARHRGDIDIRFSEIRSARLKQGLMRSGLHVTMVDGSSHQLWWLGGEEGEILAEELRELCPHLGDQLQIG